MTGEFFSEELAAPLWAVQLSRDMAAAASRIGGDEWQPLCNAISRWLTKLPQDEAATVRPRVKGLIKKLMTCAKIRAALDADAPLHARHVNALKLLILKYSRIRQRSNAYEGVYTGLEDLFRQVDSLSVSTPADQLSPLAKKIRDEMLESLRAFADTLTDGK